MFDDFDDVAPPPTIRVNYRHSRDCPSGQWRNDVRSGTTLGQFVGSMGAGFHVTVNRDVKPTSYELQDGDLVSVKYVGYTSA